MPSDPQADDHASHPTTPEDDATLLLSGGESKPATEAVNAEAARLAQRIEDLPPPFGEPVRLRLLAHWSLARIAEHLDQPSQHVVSLLLTGVRMLESAQEDTEVESGGEGSWEVTLTGDSGDNKALVELLERQDRGEAIDREQASSLHGGAVGFYLQVASQLEDTNFGAGETFTGSHGSKEGRTGRQTDTVTDFPSLLSAPQTFGEYDLIQLIGQGGMGVVYKARHRKLNRVVALKMIRAGTLADSEDLQRFYIEAEAVAKLRHPNIVAIHEVGELDGRHFFSMDYIEGPTLRDQARDNPFAPRRAAAITKTIAEALQLAHSEGIVHRDVKPANILLDAKDQPQIMDFGLAKRVEEESGVTYTGQVLGTPSYMSPEQAAGRTEEVGPLADVYSIGAVLYELLTGRPPFRSATAWETMRQVLHREPVSPRELNPEVPRDLETICLKCLQKDAEQRYPSAQELADELGRFLDGKPILARPVGTLARVWRWCKRNPKIAASLAATTASILVALVVVSVSLAITADALEESERSYRKTRDVVDYWFTQLSETPLKNQPGLQKLRKELLGRALTHYQDFLQRHEDDPSLREEIALTHFRIGLITASIADADQALASLEKALAIQQDLVKASPKNLDLKYHLSNTLTEMGRILQRLKRTDESMNRHLEARDLRQKLVAAQPKNIEYARKLANSIMNVGITQRMKFDLVNARKTIQESQDKREKALLIEPQNRLLKRDLAKGHFNLAGIATDLQDAAYRKVDWETGDEERATAMRALREAIKIFEELHKEDANDFNLRVQLATCYSVLADLQRMLWQDSQLAAEDLQQEPDEKARKEAERLFQQAAGMLNEAVQLYDDARPILETLARMNPDVSAYQNTLSSLYSELGMLQIVNNQPVKALQVYESALDVLDALIKADPNSPTYQRDKAQVLRAIASAQAHPELEQWERARANLDKAVTILTSLRDRFPMDEDYRRTLEDARAGLEELEEIRKRGEAEKRH